MVRTHPCKPTPTLRSPLCFLFSNDLLGTGLNVTMPVEADNLALADTLASPSYPPDVCFLPAWSSGLVSSPVRPRTVARYLLAHWALRPGTWQAGLLCMLPPPTPYQPKAPDDSPSKPHKEWRKEGWGRIWSLCCLSLPV